MDLWFEIEQKLGSVTDFEIVQKDLISGVKYKSNGVEKSFYINSKDFKWLVQCILYRYNNSLKSG